MDLDRVALELAENVEQIAAVEADLEPERRATAVGAYNFITGIVYLPASLLAGALWLIAPALTVAIAAVLSLLAIAVFIMVRPVAAR